MEAITLTSSPRQHTRLDLDRLPEAIQALLSSLSVFTSPALHEQFLALQLDFHSALIPLYHRPSLNKRLPGLQAMARVKRVQSDLSTLGIARDIPYVPGAPQSDLAALGWLYFCEKSSLVAAFLFKCAHKVRYNTRCEIRHLAEEETDSIVSRHEFYSQLDAQVLNKQQTQPVLEGAWHAFAFYERLAHKHFM